MTKKDDAPGTVKRRTVLRGLATGFAGAVAAPHAASLASPASAPASTAQERSAPTAEPRLFGEQELETLISLSELLVPGSVAAGAPELLNRAAAVETAEAQRELLGALRAFEGEARRAHGSRWVDLDVSRQRNILAAAASGSPPPLNEALIRLRDAVARAYFATEPGMRKLGWTPRTAWRALPACNHSGDDHR